MTTSVNISKNKRPNFVQTPDSEEHYKRPFCEVMLVIASFVGGRVEVSCSNVIPEIV